MSSAPSTPLEARVADVARRCLGPSAPADIDPDTDLESLGLDSLNFAEFLMDLEHTFDVSFPAEAINRETFRSPRSTAKALGAMLLKVQRG